jgi:hypothetical protein
MSQRLLIADQISEQSRVRIASIYNELAFAISRIERDAIKTWGVRSSKRLLLLAARRVGGMARLATMLARGSGGELKGIFQALKQGRMAAHLCDRTAGAIDGSITIGREGTRAIGNIAAALIKDPRSTAPALIGGLLGFGAGSGGLDGNGGIPDLDLVAGVGAHRSLITHTVIAGIVAEGLLLAFADLAAEVHERLPAQHDPIWDGLARIGRPLTESLAIGTSVGLAYHLLVDALIQPAALHGLPVEMPLEGHQTIMAASGLAEGANAAGQVGRRAPVEIVQGGPPQTSTGRRVVDSVAQAAGAGAEAAGNGLDRARDAFRSWRRRR